MKVKLLLVAMLALVACDPAADGRPVQPQAPSPSAMPSSQPLDALSIELQLASTTVESGRAVGSSLEIKNDSGTTVTDPECWLGAVQFALIPADEPDAELWQQIVVDCGGPFRMKDGFTDRLTGPDFQASTMHGQPLPPGDYIAALEIEGFSTRLMQPIEIVAP